MAKKEINVALVGHKFMGKTHSNAYRKINFFFDLPVKGLVAVGTALAGGPPHRSEREELPHSALILDLNGHALIWIGMFHAGSGKPSLHVSFHSRPGDAPFLTASR